MGKKEGRRSGKATPGVFNGHTEQARGRGEVAHVRRFQMRRTHQSHKGGGNKGGRR